MREGHLLRLAVLGVGLLLAACEPAYVADTTSEWARTVGLTDRYQLQRQTRYVLPRNTTLQVASVPHPSVAIPQLVDDISDSLQPYFANVVAIETPVARQAGITAAARADFLFYIRSVEAVASSAEEHPDEASGPPRYDRLVLIIELIDTANGQVFDSVKLVATGKSWPYPPQTLSDLLAEPIDKLASDMTGQVR